MNSPLRVLHLEDNVRDTELVQATLELEGLAIDLTRVETEQDFVSTLNRGSCDLILADYTLPSFDGLSALRIAQQQSPNVPFIFVSGTLGEDVAIEALKTGATDYILKTRLSRLGPAITRARREARERTERKRAEAAARRSATELRDVVEAVPAMMWSTLPDGRIDFINHRWQEFTGLPSEKALGWDWEEVIHPDDRSRVAADYGAALESDKPFELEVRLRRADGEYRWWFIRNVPLRDELGNIIKRYGTGIDIEDRKRAEQALRKSEAYLAEAQRLSHTGSWAFNPEAPNEVIYWSEEMYRIFGMDPGRGAPGGEETYRLMHPQDREGVIERFQSVLREKADFIDDYRLLLDEGGVKHLHVIGHPVLDDAGEVVEYVGTAVDVTERKHAEALQTGEKRLLEMIATGARLHEIFNALCLIIEEQRRGMLASVLLLNSDGVHLDFVSGPSLPNEWVQQMEKLPIGPCAGSCGTAAYRAAPVVVSNLATDPLWDVPEHRSAALKHGLRASWSNPVLSSKGEVLGTFCLYCRETRAPSPQDLELIELATHLVRVAIERDRAQEAVRASAQVARGQVEALMQSLDVLATAPAPDKFLGQMLLSIRRQLQASRVLLWLRSEPNDTLRLRIAVEDEEQLPEDPDHPLVKDPQGWKTISIFQEMLFTAGPVVCEETEHDARLGDAMRSYLTRKGIRKFLTVPVLVMGEVRGFIGIQHHARDPYRSEEIELAQALAHQVMLAIQLTQLAEQGRHAAILEERTRMARDIHDTLAQGFTGVVLQMDAAEEAFADEAPDDAIQHVRRARELARESLGEARRSVHALRSQVLEKAGFCDALKNTIQNPTIGTSLQSEFQVEGDVRELAPNVEENLLHIGQEALTNALKHARATRFETRLRFESDAVRLELSDNGEGFVGEAVNGGFGLIGMQERAKQIGGTLAVTSARGEGTKIVAVAPYQKERSR